MSFLAAALCAAVLSLLSPVKAEAGQYAALANVISASQHSATLLDVGYYGGGDYYGDDQSADDYDDTPKRDYRSYRYDRKHDQDYSDGCYKKKWVCEESEPRCRKARECVWYYGKEYCRDVRRCQGGGDRYCKWVSYRSDSCGY